MADRAKPVGKRYFSRRDSNPRPSPWQGHGVVPPAGLSSGEQVRDLGLFRSVGSRRVRWRSRARPCQRRRIELHPASLTLAVAASRFGRTERAGAVRTSRTTRRMLPPRPPLRRSRTRWSRVVPDVLGYPVVAFTATGTARRAMTGQSGESLDGRLHDAPHVKPVRHIASPPCARVGTGRGSFHRGCSFGALRSWGGCHR